mmetsp:Transcript_49472/g.150564  ORF Transcript_49472/g.150564 Transcript_49472/m.150564 type:complete len:215 (-) Transcript_49472:27-671(-)
MVCFRHAYEQHTAARQQSPGLERHIKSPIHGLHIIQRLVEHDYIERGLADVILEGSRFKLERVHRTIWEEGAACSLDGGLRDIDAFIALDVLAPDLQGVRNAATDIQDCWVWASYFLHEVPQLEVTLLLAGVLHLLDVIQIAVHEIPQTVAVAEPLHPLVENAIPHEVPQCDGRPHLRQINDSAPVHLPQLLEQAHGWRAPAISAEALLKRKVA